MYTAPAASPSRMPAGPSVTASISLGPGRHVAITSHWAAAVRGVCAQAAPAASRLAAASRRRSCTTSEWPAASRHPAMGLPMLPTPMNPIRIVGSRLQGVKPEDVVPEDLLLADVAERQRQESVHCARVLGVAMRIIGGG